MTMQIIDAQSPEAHSADLKAENIDKLKALFPELITEGPNGVAINQDVLKQLVGDATVTDADEKYGLNWHGKRAARQLALTPSTGTLLPCPDESVDWDTTQNLMIEGDNLEVLKLLQKSYAGKVKLIYIDPPYNTGDDFVYPDNFEDSISSYLELTGQVESGRKITSNTEASGRFHTAWLNMLHPRLKLARNLLQSDGYIAVSINDRELSHLRQIMNEIFGEENFISVLVYDKNRKNDAKLVSNGHEYMVIYGKNKSLLTELDVRLRAPKEGADEVKEIFEKLRKELNDDWKKIADELKKFYSTFSEDDPRLPLARFTKVDERGPYRDDGDPSWPGGGGPRYEVPHIKTGKPCKIPSRGWVWPTYERMKEEIDAGNIAFGQDETTIPSVRRNLFEKNDQVMRSVQFSYAQKASQDFAEIFDGKSIFQNPKSYLDMKKIVEYFSSGNDVVLDFFAGSGTTGHGVMLANADGNQRRRFILVQLPEPLDLENKDQKNAAEFCLESGFQMKLSEITKERLRRAAIRVNSEFPSYQGDFGFRVYKLDVSNIRAWDQNPEDIERSLLDHQNHLIEGRSESDILYELLLKLGLDLCVPIEQQQIAGKTVHSIGGGVLLACLAERITRDQVEDLAQGIVAWHKAQAPASDSTCVFRDSAFADDIAKTNLAAILNQAGIKNVRSL
ncbi:site-specific DNA-methyltransferase [Pseudomonas aeruginosa]|uniref:site-specific DNA-methyltransferase n=1 Tax=Pseudomonas aeruginosa TaxID=287 RepID=UPI000A45F193|nr:site-specific DNA-methyltransferase [Pseudomonas aeruginosa]MCF3988329.1 site-specific DNA-methyltransferase [Pseudomonas aeruginosa]MCF4001695.1 site-specific DNA-methyltransferase [Pseudomonas aeruginosa]MCS8339719.1 site-specific DNA-methyltransferase [Pseudomonas aeruginosa]MCS8847887.1 site-specific DNA-methyltransferase [Pseudomonas aeruginosa]MCS8853822.1 site-specific DNA-methyltransferase [Pseudomonas aeruginosa]